MSEQVASLPEVVSRGSTNGLQPQPELQSMSHEDSKIIIMVRGGVQIKLQFVVSIKKMHMI